MGARVALDAFEFNSDVAAPYDNPALVNLAIDAGASVLIVVWRGNAPTAITIGGQAMTLFDSSGTYYVYYKERPPTGASVELSVTTASANEWLIWSYSLFNSGGPPTAFTIELTSDGPNHSKSCVTKDGRSMVIDVIQANGGVFDTPTAGAGQTTLETSSTGRGSSYESATDPSVGATVEMTWTTIVGQSTHLAFAINAYDEGVPAAMTPVVMK